MKKQGPTMLMTARINPEVHELLYALAEHHGENIREVVERIITEAAELRGLRK